MGDSWNWPRRPPPPLEGGRRHPDERLRAAALAGLAVGITVGLLVAWIWP